MVESSIQREGFGRSILLANDGTIIAGNATAEAAASAGLEDMIVIDSDGSKVIAVRRTDVDPGSDRFHRLAVADNRSAELAEWEFANLQELIESQQIDPADYFYDGELDALLASFNESTVDAPTDFASYDETIETEHQCPRCNYQWSGKSS